MTDSLYIPVINLLPERLVDGDTDALVIKMNSMQNKFESWSVALNQFRLDTLDNTAFPYSGGTLTGELKVSQDNAAYIRIETTTENKNSLLEFRNNSNPSGLIYRSAADSSNDTGALYFRRYDANTNVLTTQLALFEDYIIANTEVRVVDSTNSASAVTRGHIESSYLPLTSGTLSGDLKVSKDGSAYFRAECTNTTNDAVVEFRNNSNRSGLVYRTAADASDDQGELRIRRYDTNTGTITSQLRFTDDRIISDTPIYLVDGTHSDTATTKGYVDDNFLNKETSSTQYIGGDVFLTPVSGNATIRLKGAGAGDSSLIRFLNDGQENAWINTNTGTMTLRVFPVKDANGNTTTSNNEFVMKETYAYFNKDIRCTSMGSDDDSLTTKSYVDSVVGSGGTGGITDHGALTGRGDDDHTQYHTDARGDARYGQLDSANTWTATNTFSNMGVTAVSPYLTINSDSGASSHLQFRTNSLRTALLYSGANSTILARYSNSNTSTSKITLTDNSITFNNQVYGTKVQLSGTLKSNGWTVINDVFSSDNGYIDTRKPLRYSGVTASTLDDDELVPKSYVDDKQQAVTQAQYDALTPESDVLYLITDA